MSINLQRHGMSLPETMGSIACLGVGLIAGSWMFLKDSAPPSDNARLNSTASPLEVATKPRERSTKETELQAIQRNIIRELNESTAKSNPDKSSAASLGTDDGSNDRSIEQAEVRALLGEGESKRFSTKKPPATENRPRSSTVVAKSPGDGEGSETISSGPRTLAYWNAMNALMAEEETMRSAPAAGLTKENAADFIARRGAAGSYATTALRGLDRSAVDPAVIALGSEIANWYERGTKLNDRASYLLNRADENTRRGQTGKNWGEAEKSHIASASEINRRGDALRMQMTRKYKLKFPDLR
jgi:hypothetical protein